MLKTSRDARASARGDAPRAAATKAKGIDRGIDSGQGPALNTASPVRVRTGSALGTEDDGHVWPRDPYLAEKVDDAGYPKGGGPGEWGIAARCIGRNPLQMELGGQESVTAMAHYDVALTAAGGRDGVAGDYLWRDMGEGPIRRTGEYDVLLHLHADVETTVKVIVVGEAA